jgi:hypothetical protein
MMLELLKLCDDALTSEVMSHLICGQPFPVDLCIKLNDLGICPDQLQNQYDL